MPSAPREEGLFLARYEPRVLPKPKPARKTARMMEKA
jgi:hypothetical protein